MASTDEVFAGLRQHLTQYAPVTATRLGDHSGDDRLDDWGPGAADARLRDLSGLQARLEAIDVDAQDAETDGDRILLADALAAMRFELEGLGAHVHDPLFYLDLVTAGVYDQLRREDLELGPRQVAAAARAANVPQVLAQARKNLDGIPAPHMEVALQRISGAAALFDQTLPAFAPDAAEHGTNAAVACRQFGTWLEEQRSRPAPDWRLGEARWAAALRLALGVELSPDEVWSRARQTLAVLQEQAEDLAAAVLGNRRGMSGPTLVRAALGVTAMDKSSRAALVTDAGAVLEEIKRFLVEQGEFDLPEPDTLRVEEVPQFQQGIAVAFFVPAPPLETGHPADTYYLSPIPDGWDDDRAASFLREYNYHALRSVGIHEAYPGHYVQFAHARAHPRPIRRTLWNSACAEGWAVYVERRVIAAGFDGGFGGDGAAADRMKLVSTKLYMRAVTNALLDQGLHIAGWDDEQATDLVVSQAYQEPSEAQGKLIRGKVTAGQLSTYFVGGTQMADLRRDVERAAGASFSPLQFHRDVLAQGVPPFAVLRRALLGQ